MCIFKKWDGGYGLDRAGSGYGQVAGTCECGNEPSGSIKCGGFRDWLASYQEGLFDQHSILEINASPGMTVTGLCRQLQGSSFLQKSLIRTRPHCVTYQKTTVVSLRSLRTFRRNLLRSPARRRRRRHVPPKRR